MNHATWESLSLSSLAPCYTDPPESAAFLSLSSVAYWGKEELTLWSKTGKPPHCSQGDVRHTTVAFTHSQTHVKHVEKKVPQQCTGMSTLFFDITKYFDNFSSMFGV